MSIWLQYRMPKKTRKEKIMAQNRKQNLTNASVFVKKEEEADNITKQIKYPSVVLTAEENQINKHFLHDLKKSLIIIGFVFALEFFFYFATMSNYLGRYLNF